MSIRIIITFFFLLFYFSSCGNVEDNKKSGKVASSHSWLLALAAVAHLKGNTSGISGLLPLMQAEKLLQSGEWEIKK